MKKKTAKKRAPSKRPRREPEPDVNQMAHYLVKATTEQVESEPVEKPIVPVEISRFMAEMGRRGGKVGGKARAAALSQSERSRIASLAAKKRWNTSD